MNIKAKLTLVIGALVAMIVLLVSLSIVNLQILTATEPNSLLQPGLQRALLWISTIGGFCIVIGIFMLAVFPLILISRSKRLSMDKDSQS